MALFTVTSHPYVPLSGVLRASPDIILMTLPLTLPFAVLVAGLLFVREVRAHRGFFAIQLAGKDPRAAAWPLLVIALVASVVMVWLQRSVLPAALYHVRHTVKLTADTSDALSVRLARKPRFLRGYTASFDGAEGGTMAGFVMTANREEDPPTLVTAATARIEPAPRAGYMQIRLRDGRYVRLDPDGGVRRNYRFDDLRLLLDADRLSLPQKRELIPLKYYTDFELGLLEEQRNRLIAGGHLDSRDRLRRADAVPSARALRWQSAFLPLLVMILVVQFLVVHAEGRRRYVLVAGFVMLLLLQQILLQSRVERGGTLSPAWLVLLPTIEVAAVVVWSEARRRMRRVAR